MATKLEDYINNLEISEDFIISMRNAKVRVRQKYQIWDQVPGRNKHPLLTDHTRREPYMK